MSSTPLPRPQQRPIAVLQTPLPDDSARIIFTRQLWQRNMPDGKQRDHVALDKSQTSTTTTTNAASTQKNSSLLSHPRRSRSLSSPSTPEESPSFRFTAKRSVGIVDSEDKAVASSETLPAHTRNNSSESTVPVCICQPEPKPPRPRNAFILYRQHHQSSIVSQHPGLANPEISKIIGEQWQNESTEQKNKWKALADEEKISHQQRYPNYRYQPKRSGRNNSNETSSSAEKPQCQKCGGRTVLTASGPSSVPPTPATATTPLSRTLPGFREMSLASPAAQRASSRSHQPMHPDDAEEMDHVGPLSPEAKRRRFNGDQPMAIHRTMHPQYNGQPSAGSVNPGTPFPFARPGPPIQPFVSVGTPLRRESLPGLKGLIHPQTPMHPPPAPGRPGMGYSQHRLSQGHIIVDRSLTLPPIQTLRSASTSAAAPGSGKSIDQQIDDIRFHYKIRTLCQVAPPAPRTLRGPLIAVEGDSPAVALNLAKWLSATLDKDDLAVTFLHGPQVVQGVDKKDTMAKYHALASEWLMKDKSIQDSLRMEATDRKGVGDTTMIDASSPSKAPSPQRPSTREIDNNYNDEEAESASSPSSPSSNENNSKITQTNHTSNLTSVLNPPRSTSHMELDTTTTMTSPEVRRKPITLIPNHSLHTCNAYAHSIPITEREGYIASDHWQWTATLWRGTTGPDLTVYVQDVVGNGTSGVEIETVEGRPDCGVFVVRRNKEEGGEGESAVGIESSVLRRVGFEVSEWVRAFGPASVVGR